MVKSGKLWAKKVSNAYNNGDIRDNRRIELFQKTFSKEKEIPNNIRQVIGVVIKEIEHKKIIEEIAKRNKISPKLVEQICHLYLTHPGISIDGIIKKMEIS